MLQMLSRSLTLLVFLVVICCGIYPLVLWTIGQTLFPFQANGSPLVDKNNQPIGSKLIAQPFTKDEYFQPRQSAASYDATASSSSSLAASNPALRNRVARTLGPIVKYANGSKKGQLVGPDIEKWLQNKPQLLSQYFSKTNPGKIASNKGADIQSNFFDRWRQDNPNIALEEVPGDYVTTSASGLDPHISLANAEFQLDRVALKWAQMLKRPVNEMEAEIKQILDKNVEAPLNGLIGEKYVNVLEVNLAIHQHFGV